MLQFWKNVRSQLDFKDISQKELASSINVSYNTLQSWINRDRLPDVENAVKIAKVLNTSVEFLTLGTDDRLKPNTEETIRLLEKAIETLK